MTFRHSAGIAAIFGGYIMTLFLFTVPFSPIVNSPDERANQVFALQFKETNSLTIPALVVEGADVFIGPRSTVRVENTLVPNSFFGLPVLAGMLAKVVGDFGIYLITPLFSVLGILAWFFLVRKQTQNPRIAYLSAALLATHPGYWFYSARVMMHNVPFVASLIIAAWFFLNQPVQKTWRTHSLTRLNELFAGGFFALALLLRTSEVLWVVAGLGVLVFAFKKEVRVQFAQKAAAFMLGIFLVASPFLLLNQQIFGNPFTTGYTYKAPAAEVIETESMPVEAALEVVQPQTFPALAQYLFPFGIHERAILRHAYYYFFLIFPWFGLLAILGMLFIFKTQAKTSASWRIYLFGTIGLAMWLAVVYGSWVINDNPDPKLITLGNSYIRYWLPASVLFTVPIAVLITESVQFISKKRQVIALATCVIVFALLSLHQLTFGADGFIKTRIALATFQEKQTVVLAHTADSAIIITDRSDKFLFPQRQVIVPLRDDATYKAIPVLVESNPLYYFGITLPEVDRVFLEEVRFKEAGLKIRLITTIYDESLYEIYK